MDRHALDLINEQRNAGKSYKNEHEIHRVLINAINDGPVKLKDKDIPNDKQVTYYANTSGKYLILRCNNCGKFQQWYQSRKGENVRVCDLIAKGGSSASLDLKYFR